MSLFLVAEESKRAIRKEQQEIDFLVLLLVATVQQNYVGRKLIAERPPRST